MSTSIIDQLIVILGLDPKPFKKGSEQATRQLKDFQSQTKITSEAMTKSLMGVATTIGALFVGFQSATGLFDFLGGLNKSDSDLGRFSRNMGLSAHEVNQWGLAIHLAGGDAKAAQSDLGKLSADLTNLKMGNSISPLLLQFSRLKIAIRDSHGQTRKTTDLFKDYAERLSHFSTVDAHNMAASVGVSEDMLYLLLQQKDAREAPFAQAEANNNVTEEGIKKEQRLQESYRNTKDEITAIGRSLLIDVAPAALTAMGAIHDFLSNARTNAGLQEALDRVGYSLKSIGDLAAFSAGGLVQLFGVINTAGQDPDSIFGDTMIGLGAIFDKLDRLAGGKGFGDDPGAAPASGSFQKFWDWMNHDYAPAIKKSTEKVLLGPTISAAEKRNRLPPGILNRLIDTESGWNPNAVSSAGAVGIMQLTPKFFPGAGKNMYADVDTGAAQLRMLHDDFVRTGEADDEGAWFLALQAYNAGETRVRDSRKPGGKPLAAETVNYPGKILHPSLTQSVPPALSQQRLGPESSTSHEYNTNIDTIQVLVPGGDANAIAGGISGAIQRRNLVAQADSSQQ